MRAFGKSILFGNDNNKKFTEQDLPGNRREQFIYLIRTRFSRLFGVNLLVFLFALPLIVWQVLCLAYSLSLGEIGVENFGQYFHHLLYYKSSLGLLLSIPAAYGIAGGIYTVRLMSWGEPISLFRTFFKGIRLNLWQFTLFGILYGLFVGVYDAAVALLSFAYSGTDFARVALHFGLILSAVLLISVAAFLIPLCSTYSIRTATAVKSSIGLVGKTMLKTLGVLCISVFPFAVMLAFGNVAVIFIAIALLFVFGFSYVIMVISLYTNSIFDEVINARDYPDYYRRGLSTLRPKDESQGDEDA